MAHVWILELSDFQTQNENGNIFPIISYCTSAKFLIEASMEETKTLAPKIYDCEYEDDSVLIALSALFGPLGV